MDSKELFQNQVLQDIKAIAKELSQIQSFSGLLAHQQKIQNLYEKYIFLKQLNSTKYQQILDDSAIDKVMAEVFHKEKDFHQIQKEENFEKREEQEERKEFQEEVLDKWIEKDRKEVEIEIEQNEEKIKKEEQRGVETVEENKLKPLGIEIAEIKPIEKEKKFNPVKLDFNDSIAFISQLFNGSKTDMDAELKALNETHSIEDAKKWMEEMFYKYNWKNKEEFVERLSGLIVNRFEP